MTRAEGCACAERSEPRPEPEAVAQGAPGCQRWRDHSEFFDRLLRRSLSSFFCTSALRLPADSQAGSALPTEERLYTFTELRFIAGARRPPSALRGFGMVDLWMVRERAGSEPSSSYSATLNKSAQPNARSRARRFGDVLSAFATAFTPVLRPRSVLAIATANTEASTCRRSSTMRQPTGRRTSPRSMTRLGPTCWSRRREGWAGPHAF